MVRLNVNSIIVFPSAIDKATRQVKLSEEAFFEVARNSNRPFVIMSGNVQTTVLGASFYVKAYEEESGVQVAVATGKVQVQAKKAGKVLLEPGEVSYYKKGDHSFLNMKLLMVNR